MKKVLIIFLFFNYVCLSQTTPSFSKLKITSNPEKTTVTRVVVQDATTGEVGYISKSTLETPDATSLVKGKVQLAGDLSGTATAPVIANNAITDAKVANGISASKVGLGNVDNTSDLNKPISTATQTALNTKANDNEVAKLTGNQTINGSKTFTNDLVVNDIRIGHGSGNLYGNLIIGFNTFFSNTLGTNNIALGSGALAYNTIGNGNFGLGINALFFNTQGSRNMAIGFGTLQNNTIGSSNIAIGEYTLENNTSGTNNIAIGRLSGSDAVATISTQSNQIVMGNNSSTNAYIKIGWTVTSDARDKTNFTSIPYGLDFINQLKPIQYQFKLNRTSDIATGDVKYGFKAQDILALEGANPVIIDAKDVNNLKYTESNLIPVLVKAIQELSAQVEILKNK